MSEAVRARVQRLDEKAQEAVRLAAVLGQFEGQGFADFKREYVPVFQIVAGEKGVALACVTPLALPAIQLRPSVPPLPALPPLPPEPMEKEVVSTFPNASESKKGTASGALSL